MKTVEKSRTTKNVFRVAMVTVICIFSFETVISNNETSVEKINAESILIQNNYSNPDTTSLVYVDMFVEEEPEIELEPWMLSVEAFNIVNVSYNKQNVRKLFNEDLTVDMESEIELEPWMLSAEAFKYETMPFKNQKNNGTISQELLADDESEIELEPWMLNFNVGYSKSFLFAEDSNQDISLNPMYSYFKERVNPGYTHSIEEEFEEILNNLVLQTENFGIHKIVFAVDE